MKYVVSVISLLLLVQCNSSHTPKEVESTTKLSKEDSTFYASEGTKLAKMMYVGLLTQLNKALDELGPYEAVKYCNIHAIPITDSLSQYYGIKAKRTSLKIRNPKNAPDSLEQKVLEMYQKTQAKTPTIIKKENTIHFFTPIYIAQICLTCHGNPNTDIPDVTMIALNKFYPDDKARNYELYDIRGVWHIQFPENYKSKLSEIKPNNQTTKINNNL